MKKATTEYFHLLDILPSPVLSILVISVVAMNLLANKSIDTGLPWLALDCGILFSWLTFLTMDIMTHCYGPKAASVGSLFAMVLNLFMAGMFFLAKTIPGVWGESFVEGSETIINTALDNTFGGTWFILFGSSVAFAVSAVLNNYLNWGIGEQVGKGGFGVFALRSYVSTFLAQFTDNITFALIVSRTFFGWSLLQCFTCAVTGALMELIFEVFFSPAGYRISRAIIDDRAAGIMSSMERA